MLTQGSDQYITFWIEKGQFKPIGTTEWTDRTYDRMAEIAWEPGHKYTAEYVPAVNNNESNIVFK